MSRRWYAFTLLVISVVVAASSTELAAQAESRKSETEVLAELRTLSRQIAATETEWHATEIVNPYTGTRTAVYRAQEVRATTEPLKDKYLAVVRGYPELEAYVEQLFMLPAASGAGPSAAIKVADCDQAWEKIKTVGSRLGSIGELTVSLAIRTKPVQGAHFIMRSVGLTETQESPTNGVFERVWRGQYIYSVTKPGYATMGGRLDLVLNPGGDIICELQEAKEGGGTLPCSFQAR